MTCESELREIKVQLRELRERQLSGKAWDILMKATVPVAFVLAGAMIRHEVVNHEHATRMRYVEQQLKEKPPEWLKEDVREIKERLLGIENRMRQLEKR